jgi:Mn2+/Fe2+ NRAMP family transporter
VVWLSGRCIFSIYLGFGSRPFGSLRFKPLPAPPLAAVILATDMAEMGLIIALHMLTGAAGGGGCICLDRRGPLGVAFRQTGPFREGCRAAVALSFVVELWLVRPPLWEAVLPRLPEGSAVVAAAVVGAATKPHDLLLHSHLTHGRKTHMWQTLTNLLGASAINASTQIMETAALFGRAVDLEEVPAVLEPLFGGLAAVLFSAASLSLCGVCVPLRHGQKVFGR